MDVEVSKHNGPMKCEHVAVDERGEENACQRSEQCQTLYTVGITVWGYGWQTAYPR
jgi:hypothetical protein